MPRPTEERRRHPRGTDLALRLTLGGLRWVYIYAALLATLTLAPALSALILADPGSPDAAAAGARLGLLLHEFALPLGAVALAVSAHVGWFAGRAARYLNGMEQPFDALRTDVVRHDAATADLLDATRRAVRAADDPAVSRREVSELLHTVLDVAERQAARPRATLLDPAAGEFTTAPEAKLAAGLSH
jgi:hypothetical protein